MLQNKQQVFRGLLATSLAIAVLMLTMWSALVNKTSAQSLSQSAAGAANDFPNCRFGVGVARNPLTTYNYTSTRSSWYVDWGVYSTPPASLDYYRTIRIKQDKAGSVYLPTYWIYPALSSAADGLGPIVQAHPGQVWLIGNEPERAFYQDETLPDMYAQIYHDAYTFIKGIDPTARIAIGAVIQPTPLRLQYLDRVLTAYRAKFGTSMPVDVWNIHMYILQEVKGQWGASIPVGVPGDVGMIYTLEQTLDPALFSSLIRDMRTWMKARGYQNSPLIVTEYGALAPLWWLASVGKTQTDVNAFLNSAMNYLNSATDLSIGYPADAYHLVQRSSLYSLDDDSTNSSGELNWGGFLFNSTPPYALTASGIQYLSTIGAIPVSTDLLVASASTEPGTLIVPAGGSISPTLKALVSNAGNSPLAALTKVRFWDVTGGGNVQLQPDVTLASFVNGCGTVQQASIVLSGLTAGVHLIRIQVDPDSQITETDEANNVKTVTVLVGSYGLYLPVTQR